MFSKFLMLVRLYIFIYIIYIYIFISCHFLALILKLWNVSPISSCNWSVICEGEHGQDTPDPVALSLLAHLKQDVPEKVEDEDRPNVRRKFEEWWCLGASCSNLFRIQNLVWMAFCAWQCRHSTTLHELD